MIAYLVGRIKYVDRDSLILEAGGVGYLVYCPTYITKNAEISLGGKLELWCVTQVREDSITHFGLESVEARALFGILTGISGVGGKMALNLFSELGVKGILNALTQSNAEAFTQATGVGPKMAKRLLLELKNQDKKVFSVTSNVHTFPTDMPEESVHLGLLEDALKTLSVLGYNAQEVRPLLYALLADGTDNLEDLLQRVLQSLGQKTGTA